MREFKLCLEPLGFQIQLSFQQEYKEKKLEVSSSLLVYLIFSFLYLLWVKKGNFVGAVFLVSHSENDVEEIFVNMNYEQQKVLFLKNEFSQEKDKASCEALLIRFVEQIKFYYSLEFYQSEGPFAFRFKEKNNLD